MVKIPIGTRKLFRGNQHGSLVLTVPSIWCAAVEAVAGSAVSVEMLPGNVLQIRLIREDSGDTGRIVPKAGEQVAG